MIGELNETLPGTFQLTYRQRGWDVKSTVGYADTDRYDRCG
jgi:hypothetical protein